MRTVDIINKKKKNLPLSKEEIEFMVEGYTFGKIPDYQMSAFMMAIYFNGMNEKETLYLTLCMRDSGDVIDLSKTNSITIDKHSTGGVGDKTTLILAPLVAACGGKVAKMSGRGLGFTGGTLDKIESIPGFRTNLSNFEFIDNLNQIGCSIMGQTANLAPADKKLYALRDVTGTVDSIPLIASSIMSKKLALGCDKIVLDVTVGSGAFMKNFRDATRLAKTMVQIGLGAGKDTSAVITDMSVPLGNYVGNSLEVIEAIETLKGNGPKDLTEVCLNIARQMLISKEQTVGDNPIYTHKSLLESDMFKREKNDRKNAPVVPDMSDIYQNINGSRHSNMQDDFSATDLAKFEDPTVINEDSPLIKEIDAKIRDAISSGAALKKFAEMVERQGGDPEYVYDTSKFKKASVKVEVKADLSGKIIAMDTEKCGIAASMLGAGRETLDSVINPAAGIRFIRKTGDEISGGETIAVLYGDDESKVMQAEYALKTAYQMA